MKAGFLVQRPIPKGVHTHKMVKLKVVKEIISY